MAEEVVKVIDHPSGQRRVLIFARTDGHFTYCWQEKHNDECGPRSIGAGVYDSALTAETEARQRVSWLKAIFH